MKLSSLTIIVMLVCAASTLFAQDHLTKEIQLTQPATGNAVVLQPSASAGQQTITLPAALPTNTNQVLSVASVSGTNVVTQWATPVYSGAQVSFKVKTADQLADENWEDVDDLQDSVKAGKVYEFSAMIRCDRNNNSAGNLRFDFVEADGGNNISMMYYYVEVSGDEALDNGSYEIGTDVNVSVSTNDIRVYELRGIIISSANDVIKMRFRNSNTSNEVRIYAKSFMRLITNM